MVERARSINIPLATELATVATHDLLQELVDLYRLRRTLSEAMRASDHAETWAYYGRSSREETQRITPTISAIRAELVMRGVNVDGFNSY